MDTRACFFIPFFDSILLENLNESHLSTRADVFWNYWFHKKVLSQTIKEAHSGGFGAKTAASGFKIGASGRRIGAPRPRSWPLGLRLVNLGLISAGET